MAFTIAIQGTTRVINGSVLFVGKQDMFGREHIINIADAAILTKLLNEAGIQCDVGGEPVVMTVCFPNIEEAATPV